jgi:hypothetical protein
MTAPAALGFRAHSGWTAAVAVAGSPREPVVIARRRIETADPAIAGSKQPYHAAEDLDPRKAKSLIGRCRARSLQLASDAVAAVVADLKKQGHKVVVAGVVAGSGRVLPELSAILRSHALLHTAEGEFYRDVMAEASQAGSLLVTKVPERELWEKGAAVFHISADDLEQRLKELGRSLGPPWQQDQKFAALAAWIALAESGRR